MARHKPFGLQPKPTTAGAATPSALTTVPVKAAEVPLKERGFWGQACSTEFLLLITYFSANVRDRFPICWTTVSELAPLTPQRPAARFLAAVCSQALQCQFTVGTVALQLERKGDADGSMTRNFSLALALSFLAAPWIGTAFDRFGFPRVLAFLNLLLLGVPATLLADSLDTQLLTCVLYSVGRVGLWASFFSFIGATFGFRHYGKLAGGGLLVQSLFCLLQYPLLALTLALRREFALVNTLFCVLTVAQFVTILVLHRRIGARKQHGTKAEPVPVVKTATSEAVPPTSSTAEMVAPV